MFIRPILRGRDIKQYYYDFPNLWLLYIPWHFPLPSDSIQGASSEAEKALEKEYPSVYKYLLTHKEKLSKRNKAETGIRYEWYALQRWGSKYSDDFYQQNIAWQRITKKNIFCLTEKNMVILDSMAFISHLGNNKYYLLGILNSNVIYYWINLNVPAYGSTGYRLANQFVVNMPIPVPNQKQFEQISEVVKEIVDSKVSEKSLHKNLQLLVYELYGLSEDEILYLEGQIKG